MANPPYNGQLPSGGFTRRVGEVRLLRDTLLAQYFPVGTMLQFRRFDAEDYGHNERSYAYLVRGYSTVGDWVDAAFNNYVGVEFFTEDNPNEGILILQNPVARGSQWDICYYTDQTKVYHADQLFVADAVDRLQADFTPAGVKGPDYQPPADGEVTSGVQKLDGWNGQFEVCCKSEVTRIYSIWTTQLGSVGSYFTGTITNLSNGRYEVYDMPDMGEVHIVVPPCPDFFEQFGNIEEVSFDFLEVGGGVFQTSTARITVLRCGSTGPTMGDYRDTVCCFDDTVASTPTPITIPGARLLANATGEGVRITGISHFPQNGTARLQNGNILYTPPACPQPPAPTARPIINGAPLGVTGAGNSNASIYRNSSLIGMGPRPGDLLMMYVRTDVLSHGFQLPVIEPGWTLLFEPTAANEGVPGVYWRIYDEAYRDAHYAVSESGNRYSYFTPSSTFNGALIQDPSTFHWELRYYQRPLDLVGEFVADMKIEYVEAAAGQRTGFSPRNITAADPSYTFIDFYAFDGVGAPPIQVSRGYPDAQVRTQNWFDEFNYSYGSVGFFSGVDLADAPNPYLQPFRSIGLTRYWHSTLTLRVIAEYESEEGNATTDAITITIADQNDQTAIGRLYLDIVKCEGLTVGDYYDIACCDDTTSNGSVQTLTIPGASIVANSTSTGLTIVGIASAPQRGRATLSNGNIVYTPPVCPEPVARVTPLEAQVPVSAVGPGNSSASLFTSAAISSYYEMKAGDVLVMFVTTTNFKYDFAMPVIEPGWTLVKSVTSKIGMVPTLWYRVVDQAYVDRHASFAGTGPEGYTYFTPSATHVEDPFSTNDPSRFSWELQFWPRPEGLEGDFAASLTLDYAEGALYTPVSITTPEPAYTYRSIYAYGTRTVAPDVTGFEAFPTYYFDDRPSAFRPDDVMYKTVTTLEPSFSALGTNPYTDPLSIQSAAYYYVLRLCFATTGSASESGNAVTDAFTVTVADAARNTTTGRVVINVQRCEVVPTITGTASNLIAPVRSNSGALSTIGAEARQTITPFRSRGDLLPIADDLPIEPIYFPPEEEIPFVPPPVPFPLCKTLHGYGVFVATEDSTNPEKWKLHRQQPCRMDSPKLKSALIYDLNTEIDETIASQNRPIIRRSPETPRAEGLSKKTPHTISDEPLKLAGVHVYDPFWGLLPGIAEREISYQTQYDPAAYGVDDAWGPEHVGELWLDTSRLAYLDPLTDDIHVGDADRLAAEIAHRKSTWGKLAPGSLVLVKEWTRSLEAPGDTVFDERSFGAFVSRLEFDVALARQVTAYYYWTTNSEAAPVNVKGRALSARQVASIIENPTLAGIAWIAPILPNAMLVANLHPHLNNVDSVLQIDVAKNDYEGETHHDWQLVRALDDRTPPPAHLLAGMNHALTGYDDLHRMVPDPSLHPRDRFGASVRPRRSLLATDRADMIAARRSFVDAVNAIFARTDFLSQNPNALAALTRTTPSYANLIWSQPYGTTGIEFPPANAYDFEVASHEERDAVLLSVAFYIANGYRPFEKFHWDTTPWDFDRRVGSSAKARPARVLVTNYNDATPSWSIWEVPPDAYQSDEAPGDALVLSHQFDLSFPTYAAMLAQAAAGLIPEGKRCLVEADERYQGFWTLHAYRPSKTLEADRFGFIYENAQTYRTRDFIETIDWYAPGYGPLQPPQIGYASAEARNLAELPSPENTFVRVEDAAGWTWTVWDGSNWNTVARQNGTIRLSDAFCDPSRPVYGIGNASPRLSDIETRDGTLELRQIELALRQSVLTRGQINEVFFSLLHFAHSRQDQVDWAFKTSFLTVVGFNERLEQTPIATYDTTENLLDYINEVKPFRVKTREFTRALTPPTDTATVRATDFDKPVFYDERIGAYRRLDPANPDDMAYMAGHAPWEDWYEHFLNQSFDPASKDYNPVRRIRTRLRFDRTDFDAPFGSGSGWDLVPFDILAWDGDARTARTGGSALARLLTWYEPGEHMVEKGDKDELLDGAFKGTIIDGGDFVQTETDRDSDIDGNPINGKVDIVLNPTGAAYGFRDPHHAPGRPQELVQTLTNSSVTMTARTRWTQGAPNQFTAHIPCKRIRKNRVVLTYAHVASSAAAVLVYRDGVRLIEGTDYTVDHFERAITVPFTGSARPRYIMAHVFGPASTHLIVDQHYYEGDGVSGRFDLSRNNTGLFDIVVNGERVDPQSVASEARALTISPVPPAGADVLINVLGAAPGDITRPKATHLHQQVLAYTEDQTWALEAPTTAVSPQHAATIVEVNGRRLCPPVTRYGTFQGGNRIVFLRDIADIANLTVYLDGVRFTGTIAHRPDAVIDGSDLAPGHKLVVAGAYLYANDPSLVATSVIAVIRETHDYEVENGRLTVLKAIGPEDRTVVTTFENAERMGIETHVFDGSEGGVYRTRTEANEEAYVAVWLNGLRLVSGVDYDIENFPVGFMEAGFGEPAYGYGDDVAYARVTIPGGQSPSDRIVVMAFAGRPARAPTTWGMLTATVSPALMGSPVLVNDPDGGPSQIMTAESGQGERRLYRMNSTWEVFSWDDWSGVSLAADLRPDDEEVQVRLGAGRISSDLTASNPLDLPDLETNRPGAVWIDGERIEYFELEQVEDIVTLRQLRRGTRLTGLGSQKQRSRVVAGPIAAGTALPFPGAVANRKIECILRAASGQVTGLQVERNFTVSPGEDGIAVTLLASVPAGAAITLVQEGEVMHLAGLPVRNVTNPAAANSDCPFRIRDIAPEVDSDANPDIFRE